QEAQTPALGMGIGYSLDIAQGHITLRTDTGFNLIGIVQLLQIIARKFDRYLDAIAFLARHDGGIADTAGTGRGLFMLVRLMREPFQRVIKLLFFASLDRFVRNPIDSDIVIDFAVRR